MNKNLIIKFIFIWMLIINVDSTFSQTKLEQAEDSLKKETIKIQNITEEKSEF